jgi:hypothetical protein
MTDRGEEMPDATNDKTTASGAKPAVSKPAPARPAIAKPAMGKPAASKPATSKPATAKPAPVKLAVATTGAAATTNAPAGLDQENPLHRKLRLRPDDAGVVIAPPEDDDNPLLPIPKSFLVLTRAVDLASHEGPFEYIHVFARNRADLVETFPLLCDKLGPGGSLWVSWMKQPSKRGGGSAQPGDLNENVIRRIGLTHGLVDVKVAALDRDWSALRLVHRKR